MKDEIWFSKIIEVSTFNIWRRNCSQFLVIFSKKKYLGKSVIFRSRQARKIERRLLLSAGAEVAAIPEEEGEMMEEGEDDVMMRPRAR